MTIVLSLLDELREVKRSITLLTKLTNVVRYMPLAYCNLRYILYKVAKSFRNLLTSIMSGKGLYAYTL